MNQIVLDTDVWSFLFKRDSRAELYRAHLERNTLYISFQTVAELYQWAETNNWGEGRWAQLVDWLKRFEVLDVDDETSRVWARIRSVRTQQGHSISAQDAWIAACALRHGYPLVTHNAGDYTDIPDLVVISSEVAI